MRVLVIFLALLFLASSVAGQSPEDVKQAKENALACREQMRENSLPLTRATDLYMRLGQIEERAQLNEQLGLLTGTAAEVARKSLDGLPEEEKSLAGVIKTAREICRIAEDALEAADAMAAFKKALQDYTIFPVPEESLSQLVARLFSSQAKRALVDTSHAEELLAQAAQAFGEERYEDAGPLVAEAQADLDRREADISALAVIAVAGEGFFEKYWVETIFFALVSTGLLAIFWKKLKKKKLKKKIRGLKSEKKALLELMKRAQEERLRKGTLPESLYRIRMNAYTQRLSIVREKIPVLEGMARKKRK